MSDARWKRTQDMTIEAFNIANHVNPGDPNAGAEV